MKMDYVDVKCKEGSRFLGVSEAFYHVMINLPEPISIVYSIDVITSSVEVPKSSLKKSLQAVCDGHQMLRSQITKDENGDLLFKLLNESMLKNTEWLPVEFLEMENANSWPCHIPEITKRGFVEGEPLWRLLWFKLTEPIDDKFHYLLIFASHHGIFDAKSMFDVVCNQLLLILNNMLIEKDLSDIPTPIPMTKSFEDIFLGVKVPISETPVKWYIRAGLKLLLWKHKTFPKKLSESKLKLNLNGEYMDGGNSIIHPVLLSEELTQNFIKACKKQKISVNSMLISFLTASIKKMESLKEISNVSSLKMTCALDCRKFHPDLCTSPLPSGCFTIPIQLKVSLPTHDAMQTLCDSARKVQKRVHKQNKLDALNKNILLAAAEFVKLPPDINMLELFQSANGLDVIIVSNIGLCKRVNDTATVVESKEHYFLADGQGINLSINITTFAKKMTFCICANHHWLDLKYVKGIGERMIGLVETLIKEDISA